MSRRLKLRIGFAPGIALGSTGAPDRATFAAVVDALDRNRFDSLWLPEIMTGSIPDPVVGLAFAAGRVERLKLGMQSIVPGQNVFRLARSLASLDRLSGGRLLLTAVPGIDSDDEIRPLGVARDDRNKLLVSALDTMRRLWAGEEVDGNTLGVRPQQDPLEVWLGGMGPIALRRAGRLSDGWIPGFVSPEEVLRGKAEIEAAAKAAGREISPEHFGANIPYARGPLPGEVAAAMRARQPTVDPAKAVPVGWDAVRERIRELYAGGVSKFVVRPAVAPRAEPAAWTTEIESAAAELVSLQT